MNFAVNGRFLSREMTGVQRYAFNVIRMVDEQLDGTGLSVPILCPRSAVNPKLNNMPLVEVEGLDGHLWEQLQLPIASDQPLLNLCNTAPVLKSKQTLCIHDANVFEEPESYSRTFTIYYKALQTVLARRGVRITTVSEFSACKISQYLGLPLKNIDILPNGHEHVHSWQPDHSKYCCKAFENNQSELPENFVLLIGSNAKHKNMELVLQLAPSILELGLRIVVVGGGSNIFKKTVLVDAGDVIHLGFVNDNDIAFLLRKALCLLFPSKTEGFGLPVLESMALGCPVISSNRASLPEVCGDSALLAEPDDKLEWVRHLRALNSSSTLRDELIHKGKERAKLFSWTQTASNYVSIMNA